MTNKILSESLYKNLLKDLAEIISLNKKSVENFANSKLAITYWEVGKRIEDEKLTTNANYYNLILEDLTTDLNLEKTTLTRSVQFFKYYKKKPEISNLTWSHYKSLIALKDNNLRKKIEKIAKNENWNVAKLNQEIKNSNLGSEITAVKSKKIKRPNVPNYLYKAKIIDVIDGDTMILAIDLGFNVIKEQRIRLSQINAPELKKAGGKKSYYFLRDLAAKLDEVVVRTNKVDIYGRYLGDIFFLNEEKSRGQSQSYYFKNGVYLSQYLVENGVADVM